MQITREEIENTPAGPALNQLVSEHVMGHVRMNIDGKQNLLIDPADLPTWRHLYPQIAEGWVDGAVCGIPDVFYSQDMGRAWLVVEKLTTLREAGDAGAWWDNFWDAGFQKPALRYLSQGDAAAAICRAAVIAMLPRKSLPEVFDQLSEYFKDVEFLSE